MKEQTPEEGGDGWRPRSQDSKLQQDDRPALELLSVKVLVKAQMQGGLLGLDPGGAVRVQSFIWAWRLGN